MNDKRIKFLSSTIHNRIAARWQEPSSDAQTREQNDVQSRTPLQHQMSKKTEEFPNQPIHQSGREAALAHRRTVKKDNHVPSMSFAPKQQQIEGQNKITEEQNIARQERNIDLMRRMMNERLNQKRFSNS